MEEVFSWNKKCSNPFLSNVDPRQRCKQMTIPINFESRTYKKHYLSEMRFFCFRQPWDSSRSQTLFHLTFPPPSRTARFIYFFFKWILIAVVKRKNNSWSSSENKQEKIDDPLYMDKWIDPSSWVNITHNKNWLSASNSAEFCWN